jgi:3-deoxy-manno-octulosonate cytidylyltransferase (CMP-KDO synthetase)
MASHPTVNLSFVGIIPARFASTRFPGKPLADIGGKTMIQRVYEQASKVLDKVYVATDDKRIYKCVTDFGGKALMTSTEAKSGTDRCYEAVIQLQENFDAVINIQGDEPFIQPEEILTLQQCFEDEQTQIATLAKIVPETENYDYIQNPNRPKIVLNKNHEALYFSRQVIPYQRNAATEHWISNHHYYVHVGIYAYRTEILKELCSLPISSLEKAESLEQLRWLENGYRIKVGFTTAESYGIDTPEDLEKVRKMFLVE